MKAKTAVIGVGNMGKNHARIYSEISDIVAVSDISKEVGMSVAKQYDTIFYADYRKMLEEEKLEAVSVVTPTKLHYEVVKECLVRKIPTLVEKPIADNIKDSNELLSIAKRNNTFFMVGHIERFNPAIKKLKEILDKGRLGTIINLLAIRVGFAPPKDPNSDVVLGLGIHDIDIFNFLLKSLPVTHTILRNKIYKQNIADQATILLEYKDASCIIQTNWITPIKIRKLFVTSTKSYIELDYIKQKLIIYESQKKLKSYDSFFELISLSDSPKKQIFVLKEEPLKEELNYFLLNRNSLDYSIAESAIEAIKIIL